ncbi:redoxin domain-containing protein [Cadophora sp. DSE1049]|nr:redoxin domain-containing protein [Cadophora sp. DSE1049]
MPLITSHLARLLITSSAILKAKADIVASFDPNTTVQIGSILPQFTLPDATGIEIKSASLLAKGPLLITFYRGSWCPFCNLALRAFQTILPQIEAKGVTFIAISPELPDISLSTKEKHELEFTVLSDVGNRCAKELGIVYQQPEELRGIFEGLGNDLRKRNGDDSFAVPVPMTILVDGGGVVRKVHVEADYFVRLDPDVTLGWIDEL